MSFWSTLGKIVGIGAAPFTGGASLIPVAIATGGEIVGNVLQKRGQDKATKAQLAANQAALDFEKGIYDRDVREFERWDTLTDPLIGRFAERLHGSRPAPATAASVMAAGQGQPGGFSRMLAPPRTVAAGQPPAAAAMPGGVQMQDPTSGEIRMVRPESVAKYEARGARRVS